MSEEELNQMSNNELIGIIKAQKFEIEQLENTRKEAIEYLEKPYRDDFDYSKATLLDILDKGDNNGK